MAIRRFHAILEKNLKPNELTVEDVLRTSVFLVLSLVVAVPLIYLITDISLLILVPVAGICYALYLYRSDRMFAGVVSAFFVLLIFKANIPLIQGPGKASLNIYLVDFLAIGLLGFSAYKFAPDVTHSISHRLGKIAVGGFAVFVVWTYLSAVVGNGPSKLAATIFAIQQTRYFVVFVVSIIVVSKTDFRVGLYPLMLSISGNLLYAIAEALSGQTFGLTYLGDGTGSLLSEFAVGPWTFQAGLYASGFVRTTRQLIGLLLLLLPLLVFWTVYGSRIIAVACGLGIMATEFIVRFGQTDAGWMASILVLVVAGTLFLISTLTSRNISFLRGSVTAVYGIGLSGLLFLERVRGWMSPSRKGEGTNNNTGGSGTGDPTGGGSGGTHSEKLGVRERIVELFSHIPLVRVDTLGIRLTQYAAAIDIALSYPLVGIGGYNFILVSGAYLPSEMGIHNTFLAHLAATGIPGALAYTISILATLALIGWKIYYSTGEERLLWGCIFSGLLGFHAYSFWVVIYGWMAPNMAFWALSGIVIGSIVFGSSTVDSKTHAIVH